MALVLAFVVVALALVIYLLRSPHGFGPALRYSLVIPAIVIFSCIAIFVSRVLPPRSNWILVLGISILAMTVVEVIAVITAVDRLIRTRELRTRPNVVTAILGGLSLLPAIAVGTYLVVVARSHYAG